MHRHNPSFALPAPAHSPPSSVALFQMPNRYGMSGSASQSYCASCQPVYYGAGYGGEPSAMGLTRLVAQNGIVDPPPQFMAATDASGAASEAVGSGGLMPTNAIYALLGAVAGGVAVGYWLGRQSRK